MKFEPKLLINKSGEEVTVKSGYELMQYFKAGFKLKFPRKGEMTK